MMEKFQILRSRCVPVPLDNIDTDQIIPARFLKATTRELVFFGKRLFNDWRYLQDGAPNPEFVLNNPRYSGQILIGGSNFGCGSSREHAAWAIAGAGFRAVVASSFADIHRNNELNNGVLPVQISPQFLQHITQAVLANPNEELEIHLPNETITLLSSGEKEHFPINQYKKHCFLNGLDDIGYLLETLPMVEKWEEQRNREQLP